jgi:hypothetical protein
VERALKHVFRVDGRSIFGQAPHVRISKYDLLIQEPSLSQQAACQDDPSVLAGHFIRSSYISFVHPTKKPGTDAGLS